MTTEELVERLKAAIAAIPDVLDVGSVAGAPFTIGVSAEEDNYTVTVQRVGLFELHLTDHRRSSGHAANGQVDPK